MEQNLAGSFAQPCPIAILLRLKPHCGFRDMGLPCVSAERIPYNAETWVPSLLGWEDPSKRGRLTTPVVWLWKILHGLPSMGSQKVGYLLKDFLLLPQLTKDQTSLI